jgi:uncharacterized protein (DUF58 family)
MLAAPTRTLRAGAASWARRRQGADPLSVTLEKRRIYILPSRFGIAFGLMILAMLLASLNYASSLGFALTFLLTGLGLVIMRHCHNNLRGTRIRFASARPVFAGERAEFQFSVSNDAPSQRFEIMLSAQGLDTEAGDLGAGESQRFRLNVDADRRGVKRLERFLVTTRYPGNLFRAWAWVHMDLSCIVYPRPAPRGRPLPFDSGGEGLHGGLEPGDTDFIGLAAATPSDPPRRIAWKAYARNDELMVKQFATGAQQARMLSWDDLPELDTERRLSQLARWCLDAAERDYAVGLVLPGKAVPPGHGHRHVAECLRLLALFEEGPER